MIEETKPQGYPLRLFVRFLAAKWRRERDSNPCGRVPKRFSRSLPKNTVSAQFGAFCAKTIPENSYFTRLWGTVWNRYELKRIDRNRYRPLVF